MPQRPPRLLLLALLLLPAASAGSVRINELLASSSEGADWVELAAAEPADLSGWCLSDAMPSADDERGSCAGWRVPAGTRLGSGELFEIELGEAAGFGLAKRGDRLVLADVRGAVVSSVSFGKQERDVSYGIAQAGGGARRRARAPRA